MIDEKDIDVWFTYHPPTTEERKAKHLAINEGAKAFAKVILANVKDTRCRELAFYAIQQARMLANQGATVDEICPESKPVEKVEQSPCPADPYFKKAE